MADPPSAIAPPKRANRDSLARPPIRLLVDAGLHSAPDVQRYALGFVEARTVRNDDSREALVLACVAAMDTDVEIVTDQRDVVRALLNLAALDLGCHRGMGPLHARFLTVIQRQERIEERRRCCHCCDGE